MTRLQSLTFDRHQQPHRATIVTPYGRVRVAWQSLHGERCWFSLGCLESKRLAVPLIQRLERLFQEL